MRKSSFSVIGLGIFILVLGFASVVWACSPQAKILGASTSVGPTGTSVVLTGERLVAQGPEGAPVEIRWNGFEGQKLAEVQADPGGNFTVEIRIPQAPPGIYYLVASDRNAGVARISFEVTPSPVFGASGSQGGSAANASSDLWKGFDSKGRGERAGIESGAPGSSSPARLAGIGFALVGGLALFGSMGAVYRRRAVRRNLATG